MNRCIVILSLLLMTVTPVLTACSPEDGPITENPMPPAAPDPEEPEDNDSSDDGNNGGDDQMNRNITICAGGHSFTATLENSATARAFAALLPMTITMNEMNGNEKYHYLSDDLPTDSYRPGTIRKGDLMLYGSSCLVLFYKTFPSSYSYTRLGRLDDPSGLASALGDGNVTVTFEPDNF